MEWHGSQIRASHKNISASGDSGNSGAPERGNGEILPLLNSHYLSLSWGYVPIQVFDRAIRNEMKLPLVWLALTHVITSSAQLSIEWQHCYGGSSQEEAKYIQQTADGGFIVVGRVSSNDGDLVENHGSWDAWAFRINPSGTLVWQRAIGGSGPDEFNSVRQTKDGGFILVGTTFSNDGDMVGNHGLQDLLLVKLNSLGEVVWQRLLGGSSFETGDDILVTKGGRLIVAGSTVSTDGDVLSPGYGSGDYWIVQTDALGSIIWEKRYGGNNSDFASSIVRSIDGGYLVAGHTYSTTGQITGHHNWEDYWIMDVDTSGSLLWQSDLGGAWHDNPHEIRQRADGVILTVGYSSSDDGDVTGNHGWMDMADVWLTRQDPSGVLIQEGCYGGTGYDQGASVTEGPDGSILVCSSTGSNNGDVTGNPDWSGEIWLAGVDDSGSLLWQQCIGGSYGDIAAHMERLSNGGYILCGTTGSNDQDVSGNHGSDDIWVVKLEEIATATITREVEEPFVGPNPTTGQVILRLGTQPRIGNGEVRVLDLFGRTLISEALSGNNTAELTLPQNAAAGVYVVNVLFDGASFLRRPVQLIK